MKTSAKPAHPTRELLWKAIFDSYGIKTATSTDKKKSAYVEIQRQLNVFS
ncbi:hypothetical protein [uncultured Pseudomonas sp.]|tara:strand:+ start:2432 stop:2581 length:150 start_codon:yes stop_codon:yes gene_type:complete